MIQCTQCLCWVHNLCVSLVQLTLPSPYSCPNCAVKPAQGPVSHVKIKHSDDSTMSPESRHLATLLADVPDTSETEDEDPAVRAAMIQSKRAIPKHEIDSDGTMSLTDGSELARFHQQRKSLDRRPRRSAGTMNTPDHTRLIRSDADFVVSAHPTRSRTFDNLHTDNILSSDADFLGFPFDFNLDSGLQPNNSMIGQTSTCTNNVNLASDPPVQWPLDTFPMMNIGNSMSNTMNTINIPTQISQPELNGELSIPPNVDLASFLNSTRDGASDVNNLYSELIASDTGIPEIFNSFSNANSSAPQDFHPTLR